MSDFDAAGLPLGTALAAPSAVYVKRRIDVSFILNAASGTFGGSDSLTLSGFRCSLTMVKAIGAMTELHLRIWGMTLAQMDQLATLNTLPDAQNANFIIVQAGDNVNGITTVFQGNVKSAVFDGKAQPQVAYQILAIGALVSAMKPVPPISLRGPVDVGQAMQTCAGAMGCSLENNGVNVQLPTSYWPGTTWMQTRAIARSAGIEFIQDDATQTLAIWPRGQGRAGAEPVITPAPGGTVAYPTFAAPNLNVTTLFNPAIIAGGFVRVVSQIKLGPERWRIFKITYVLESELPGGSWFQFLEMNTILH